MTRKYCCRCGQPAQPTMLLCTACGHRSFQPAPLAPAPQNTPTTRPGAAGSPALARQAQQSSKRNGTGSVPLVQARLMSRPVIAGLTLFSLLAFMLLLSGGDKVADVAVNLTPFGNDRALAEGNAEFKKAVHASLPAEDPLARQVSAIGERLVAAIPDGTPFTYRFHVIPDKVVNAFAVPGGDIFIHGGMIELAGTPAQLAAVLAHEIQHVEQRHGLRSVYRQVGRFAMFSMVLGIFGDNSAGLFTQLSVLKHSRALESEADLRGLKLMYAAGFPREAMVDMLNGLARQGGGPPTWLSSHPDTVDRAQTVASARLP